MIQINLLPWRDQSRLIKKIQLYLALSVAAIIAIFITFIFHCYFNSFLNAQEQRNRLIENALNEEKTKLVLLEKKQLAYSAMKSQIDFIIKLRTETFKAITLLNELLTIVPPTIEITKIIRDDPVITIIGNAESNPQVTLFMNNISASSIFYDPVLTEISKEKNSSQESGSFKLRVDQKDT